MELDEINLAARARLGDVQAFGELYGRVYRRLYAFAYRILLSREDAEDVVSATAMEAFASIRRLKKSESFEAWIFAICRANCNKQLKVTVAKRTQQEVSQAELPSPEDLEGKICGQSFLEDALSVLSRVDREMVLLTVLGNYKSPQLAVLYGIPPGTIRSRLSRAYEKMRKYLGKESF